MQRTEFSNQPNRQSNEIDRIKKDSLSSSKSHVFILIAKDTPLCNYLQSLSLFNLESRTSSISLSLNKSLQINPQFSKANPAFASCKVCALAKCDSSMSQKKKKKKKEKQKEKKTNHKPDLTSAN